MTWIEDYMASTENIPSPALFRQWAAITAVSGALERKVWITARGGKIYPNLFTLLVGPPASGKSQAINPISDLWGCLKGLHKSPDNVTKPALIDSLSKSLRTVILNGGSGALSFSALNVIASEFGVFFTHHDLEFLSVLNYIYDGRPAYKEERRTVEAINILRPNLVILAGTQPDFLSSFLPDEAWGMGFASRLVMVYCDKPPVTDFFASHNEKDAQIIKGLNSIFLLQGEFIFEELARNELNSWLRAGLPPQPTHNKLQHYIGRRDVLTAKLSMIACASRSDDMVITIEDLEQAKDWIIKNEKTMPDIFKAMNQKSDIQIIKDMHYDFYKRYSTVALDKRKPFSEGQIWEYLGEKVQSNRVKDVFNAAVKMGYFSTGKYPDEWLPRAMNYNGKEIS